MRNFSQTDNFTVFGGFYPAEAHNGDGSERRTTRTRGGSIGPVAAVLVALVLGATTAAGAVTATKRIHETNYGLSVAKYSTIPGVARLEQQLY